MRALPAIICACALAPSVALGQQAVTPPLQALIDATPDGGRLQLQAGVYAGPAIITRPITLDGGGRVTVTGGGAGTIITLHGSQITVQGLKLRDSGHRHENLDACIRLENASFNIVKDNDLEGCLVGIDLRQADDNVLRRNRIHGTDPDFSDIRGDSIRIWRSNNNKIERNTISNHRDLLFEYSTQNTLAENSVTNGRYGTHFMYASGNTARNNSYAYNTVGIFSMYSNELCLTGNRITRGNGPAGMGIGLKEASGLTVENNQILSNAIGLYIDGSPFDADDANTFRGNQFAFNGAAVQLHSDIEGNTFKQNAFKGNYSDVVSRGGNGATKTIWDSNYWDAYEGFDRTNRGIGDTPFEVYSYTDRIWSDIPMTSFYRGSLVIESIDFLSRLAPFSKPLLVLRDEHPAMRVISSPSTDCGPKDAGLAQ